MYLNLFYNLKIGEVAERLKAAVLKTVEGLNPPRVRIPASPPYKQKAVPCGPFFVCTVGNEIRT